LPYASRLIVLTITVSKESPGNIGHRAVWKHGSRFVGNRKYHRKYVAPADLISQGDSEKAG